VKPRTNRPTPAPRIKVQGIRRPLDSEAAVNAVADAFILSALAEARERNGGPKPTAEDYDRLRALLAQNRINIAEAKKPKPKRRMQAVVEAGVPMAAAPSPLSAETPPPQKRSLLQRLRDGVAAARG
jgi:hypothetical protein